MPLTRDVGRGLLLQPYQGRIEDLPQRLQTLYGNRREENLLMIERRTNEDLRSYQVRRSQEAADEARLYIARVQHVEAARRRNKAAQLPLFN
jgi:hypothetical protein